MKIIFSNRIFLIHSYLLQITPKSKITDVVIVRHTTGQEPKSTLILLCEDGSLRIYTANPEQTGYWLSPAVAPPASSFLLSRSKRAKNIPNRHKGQQVINNI